MLNVTNNGQCEPITKYSGYERYEVVSGSLELSFTSFFHADNPGHDLIVSESILEKDGFEYVVKQLTSKLNVKQVVALSTFFSLNASRKEDIFGGTKTFNEFADWLFTDTGWTYSNTDIVESVLVPNFGNGNVIELLTGLLTSFKCEYQIMPNNHVVFAKEIGPDNDAQYRYGQNIKALSRKEDTTKLRTRIKGYGANGLEVTYTSPNVSQFGIRDAEPVSDDRFEIADSLIDRIKQDLIDYPEVSIELDAIELQQKEIGERVWLIYEPLNIEFQTRVLSKKSRIPEIKSTVTIGNTIPKTVSDLLTDQKIEIKQNQKQVSSKIEQTNDRITLEVTSIDGQFAEVDTRFDVTDGLISSKVSQTDYNGNTITSLITQDAYSISFLASQLNLQGLVTVTNLNTPGQTIIDGGNLKANSISSDKFYGSMFTVGQGVGQSTHMDLWTGDNNAHYIKSYQAAGFRVESTGSLSLQSGSGYGIYANSQLYAYNGFIGYGVSQFNNGLTVNGQMSASSISNSYGDYYTPGSYHGFYVSGSQRMSITYSQLTMQGTIKCTGLDQTSDVNLKTDIKDYTESALQKIIATPIVSYRYKEEDETARKTVGIIAQTAPDELYSPSDDGCAVSLYPMTSLAWKAIQEIEANYSKEITDLKTQLSQLESEINLLKGAA